MADAIITYPKFCVECKSTKDSSEFHNKDSKCKACRKAAVKRRKTRLEPLKAHKPKRGIIYAIRNPHTGQVKIGFTTQLEIRMTGYASHAGYYMELLATWEGDTKLERDLVESMREYQALFDWCYPNPIFDSIVERYRS